MIDNRDQNNYYTERSQQRSSQKIFVLFCNNFFSECFQSGDGITCQPLIGCSLNNTHSYDMNISGNFPPIYFTVLKSLSPLFFSILDEKLSHPWIQIQKKKIKLNKRIINFTLK